MKESAIIMNNNLLDHNVLFQGMSDAERKDCLSALKAREKAFAKGSAIMLAGEPVNQMGIVLSGSVTIESNDVWGNCTILSHVGTGQVFAETYALLSDEVMLVDVTANEDSRIVFLHVGNLLQEEPSSWRDTLIRNLLQISLHKNLTLSGRSFHTAPKSCRGRLLSYLNSVSLQKHSTEFDIPFNRQQLADYLNLERTNMSKELTRMQKDGIIQFRKSHFRLLQKD